MKHCRAKTARGKPCSAFAIGGSEFCFAHAPEQATARMEARRRGGYHRRNRSGDISPPSADLKSLQGLVEWGKELIEESWRLPNSNNRARALGQLLHLQKELLESHSLEERLSALEAVLRIRKEKDEQK